MESKSPLTSFSEAEAPDSFVVGSCALAVSRLAPAVSAVASILSPSANAGLLATGVATGLGRLACPDMATAFPDSKALITCSRKAYRTRFLRRQERLISALVCPKKVS
ncbi:MAG: hypothetical protein IPN95_12580 [Bacteroidetes bacterium]|nr:hypothetical protein [Bacteroidota bacterium]